MTEIGTAQKSAEKLQKQREDALASGMSQEEFSARMRERVRLRQGALPSEGSFAVQDQVRAQRGPMGRASTILSGARNPEEDEDTMGLARRALVGF